MGLIGMHSRLDEPAAHMFNHLDKSIGDSWSYILLSVQGCTLDSPMKSPEC